MVLLNLKNVNMSNNIDSLYKQFILSVILVFLKEHMTGFVHNIEKLTTENENFRKVLYTGQHAQLVVMSLLPNEDIGFEVHEIVDQFIRIESGEGRVLINGESHIIAAGDAIIVPAGSRHNIENISSTHPMKLYTLYTPPHHKDGIVHATKVAAQKDTTDHI